MQEMNRINASAQQCLNHQNFPTAMWRSLLQQSRLSSVLPLFAFNSSSISPANDEQHERKQKKWWILDEQVKKVWEKLREFGSFWFGIWANDCGFRFSVMIRLLYLMLIQLLNMIKPNWKWLARSSCYVNWQNCPFSPWTNGTVNFCLQQVINHV